MITIAVSGINAIDNPGPGTGIAQALKESGLEVRIIGLAYDAMEPGIYMDWVIDKSYLLPYPSSHIDTFKERLIYINQQENIDILLPALDAELPLFMSMEKDLQAMGIKSLLPRKEAFNAIQKSNLAEIAEDIGVKIPETKTLSNLEELHKAAEEFGFPLMVKGPFYEAYKAYNLDEAYKYFHDLAYRWGYPIIAQQFVKGDEYNLVGLGDGQGSSLGELAVKKMMVTKQGKVWTNVSIKNEQILEYSQRMLSRLNWAGGYELELLLDSETNEFYMIEINPRFPAWVYMAANCGVNLPERLVKFLMGQSFDTNSDYDAGKMLIRYTGEMVRSISDFEQIAVHAES